MRAVKQIGFHRDFENYWDLLVVLLQTEMKVRYKSKALGYLWSIAHPLAHSFIFFIAFKIMMRVRVEDYAIVLISGLFPWQWFANSVGSAPKTFVGNALIKKLNFPKIIIPLTAILNHMIHFLLSLPVIVIFLLIHDRTPSLSWIIGIPILLFIQFLLVLGIVLIFSSLNLFLRDLERLVGLLVTFCFYLTPIIYSEEMIPAQYKPLIVFHPFAPLLISWRNLFLEGTFQPIYLLSSFIYAMIFLAIGFWVYKKLSWKFAEIS